MKTLVIGDIQGCYQELQDLLQQSGLSQEDRIVAVGDLVDRGPESPAVLNFFRSQINARSVMGNHEYKHIEAFENRGKTTQHLIAARERFADSYPDAVAFMKTLPLYLELPDAIVVHAFFEPEIPLNRQRKDVLLGLAAGEGFLKEKYHWPWYDIYTGTKPLIVGHRDYSGSGIPLVYKDRVYCIDTGCCYGRKLTGVLLPDFRLFTVAARSD